MTDKRKQRRRPKDTPSQVAGKIRARLKAIIDPHLSTNEELQMWEFFDTKCAFCNNLLTPGKSGTDRDHLVSKKHGGLNHVSNRVPACAECNGNDKREMDWRAFLRCRVETQYKSAAARQWHFKNREKRILAWM